MTKKINRRMTKGLARKMAGKGRRPPTSKKGPTALTVDPSCVPANAQQTEAFARMLLNDTAMHAFLCGADVVVPISNSSSIDLLRTWRRLASFLGNASTQLRELASPNARTEEA